MYALSRQHPMATHVRQSHWSLFPSKRQLGLVIDSPPVHWIVSTKGLSVSESAPAHRAHTSQAEYRNGSQ